MRHLAGSDRDGKSVASYLESVECALLSQKLIRHDLSDKPLKPRRQRALSPTGMPRAGEVHVLRTRLPEILFIPLRTRRPGRTVEAKALITPALFSPESLDFGSSKIVLR